MPFRTWSVGEEMTAADFNAYISNQCVPAFDDAAQRTTQLAAPATGQLSTLETRPEAVSIYNGSAWVDVAPLVQYGESVVTTNGAGGADIFFPTAFAAAPAITLTDGDVDGDSQLILGLVLANKTLTSFTVLVRHLDGSIHQNAGARVNWIAVGPRP